MRAPGRAASFTSSSDRSTSYDLATGKEHAVPIEIAADLTEVRPHFQNVAREIRDARISPTGVRAVFEAHGEILTAPAEKGDIRNLTNTPGVMDRTPAWSPDGQSIAYFSDESGEYALHIKPQSGAGETRKIAAGREIGILLQPASGRRTASTSRSTTISSTCGMWMSPAGKLTKVDTDYFYEAGRWSSPGRGDSKWIAYSKSLPNRLHAISVVFAGEPARARRSPTA